MKQQISGSIFGQATAPNSDAPTEVRHARALPMKQKSTARIFWHGRYYGEDSLARMSVELARRIKDQGTYEMRLQGEPTPEIEEKFGLEPYRREQRLTMQLDELAIVQQPHHILHRPNYERILHLSSYRWGALPISWKETLLPGSDHIACVSPAVRKTFLRAGFPAERLPIVPQGFDPAIFHPDAEALAFEDPAVCVFLYVGSAESWKNTSAMLQAYVRAFAPNDPVALYIRRRPAQVLEPMRLPREYTLTLRQEPHPRAYVIDLPMSDAHLAGLYRASDALILPSRNEGFGLAALEAMACGTPAIVTAGLGCDAFIDDEVGYRVRAEPITYGDVIPPETLLEEAFGMEISVDALAATMRRVFDDRQAARERGKRAAERAHAHWTWDHAAAHLEPAINAALAIKPKRTNFTNALWQYENKISSQNGEDGIIMELFSRLRVKNPYFVEFGVETGVECNSALLATRMGWSGLFIEGNQQHAEQLSENYQEYPVACVHAVVTPDNINEIFEKMQVPNDFDLLSIDIDGHDYYVWEALNRYRPRVVCIEYNPYLGAEKRLVMEYNPDHSWVPGTDYYGASLASLVALGMRLGYAFIGAESRAANAFFVRRDLLQYAGFPELSVAQGYRQGPYQPVHREGPWIDV